MLTIDTMWQVYNCVLVFLTFSHYTAIILLYCYSVLSFFYCTTFVELVHTRLLLLVQAMFEFLTITPNSYSYLSHSQSGIYNPQTLTYPY